MKHDKPYVINEKVDRWTDFFSSLLMIPACMVLFWKPVMDFSANKVTIPDLGQFILGMACINMFGYWLKQNYPI